MEKHVNQVAVFQEPAYTSARPSGDFSTPIVLGPFGDSFQNIIVKTTDKPLTESQMDLFFGGKMKVECALGEVRAKGDLLDGRAKNSIL